MNLVFGIDSLFDALNSRDVLIDSWLLIGRVCAWAGRLYSGCEAKPTLFL